MTMHGTVLIIGGSNGIGLAAAKRLSKQKSRIIIAGRSKEKLAHALAELPEGAGSEVADFSDEEQVVALFDRVGFVDHIVLCASSHVAWGPCDALATDAVRKAFDNKFWGYWLSAHHGLAKLSSEGSIIMVTGAAHRAALAGTTAVAAVNGAIAAFAITLAAEIAPRRVNVISPGLVDTPAYAWMSEGQRQATFAETGKKLPVGRIGNPDEIAAAIEMVLNNGYMTGAVVDVDGGVHLARG